VLNAFGGVDTGSIGFYINPAKPESYVNISAIIGAIITFLITALVVYFVFVAPMKKILDIAARRKQPVKADPKEVDLLIEIRDLLKGGTAAELVSRTSSAGSDGSTAPAPTVES
jgi:large conductance mechanosensitive channel